MSSSDIRRSEKRPLIDPREIDPPDPKTKRVKISQIGGALKEAAEKALEGLPKLKRKGVAVVAPDTKKVRFSSEPRQQEPGTVGDVLHDLVREVDAIARGTCSNTVWGLWSGLSERLRPVLARERTDEADSASTALAVILLATSHADLEQLAHNGDAAGFSESLARIREDMSSCPPDRSWQDADVEVVLRGILRICMHAAPDDAIGPRALEMLGALCGRARLSGGLSDAMTKLVRAARKAWFNLDRVRGMSRRVADVINELRKIGLLPEPVQQPGMVPKG